MQDIWIRATSNSPSSSLSPSASGVVNTSLSSSATPTTHGGDIFPFSSSSSAAATATSHPLIKQSVPQLVLEWIFALAAIGILVLLLFCRYTSLRRAGRPARELFSRGPPQRPPSPGARPFRHSIRHPYNHPGPRTDLERDGIILPSQPLHSAIHSDALFTIPTFGQEPRRNRNRAVTGAGTDAGGRRLDSEDVADGKEYLPAYDAGRDGPPKYAELMSARVDDMEMADLGSPSTDNGAEHEAQNHDVSTSHERHDSP